MSRNVKFITGMLLLGAVSFVSAQEVMIRFDNTGDEAGVTTPGTTSFEFMGSAWEGGAVESVGISSLYASGAFSYTVQGGPAMVVFDQPVENVSFFYVHGSSFSQGTATAFDAQGNSLASVDSNSATGFGDPGNFVEFATNTPISAIEFTSGVIDNFSFSVAEGFMVDIKTVEGQWVTHDEGFRGNAQGLTFDYIEFANVLFMAWFTYTSIDADMQPPDPDMPDVGSPDNRWLVGQMELDGNVASGTLSAASGGIFDAPPNDNQQTAQVGTVSIEFIACDEALVSYEIFDPPLSRTIRIIPLEKRQNTEIFTCEVLQ